jgi:alpha-L-arabinofuranosidase
MNFQLQRSDICHISLRWSLGICRNNSYRVQEKEFFAEARGAPSQASDRQAVACEGGARASEGRGVVLTHSDMRARNTFQNTNEVTPSALPVTINNEGVAVTIPRQAVVALELRLV